MDSNNARSNAGGDAGLASVCVAIEIEFAATRRRTGRSERRDLGVRALMADRLAKLVSDAGRHIAARASLLRIRAIVFADEDPAVGRDDRCGHALLGAGTAGHRMRRSSKGTPSFT